MQDLSTLGIMNELQLKDGSRLRYLKTGQGEPLLLMHTIRTQLDYFEAVIPTLAKHYTVYAVDLPGHGYSSIDKHAAYDEPYLRKGMIGFVEEMGFENLTLVGESIGAVLALTIASQLPQRVKRVVASNTYDYDKRYGDGIRRGNGFANFIIGNLAIPYHGAVFAAMGNKFVLGRIMAGGMGRQSGMPDKLLNEFNTVGNRPGYHYVERKVLAGWRSWGEAQKLYAGIKAPVQLVYGEYDWSSTAERKITASKLGNPPIITLPRTGHFAFVDNPSALIEIILKV